MDDGHTDKDTGEYVYYISDYPRYMYYREPAKTVEVTLYLGELVNMGDGQYTANVVDEDLPQE